MNIHLLELWHIIWHLFSQKKSALQLLSTFNLLIKKILALVVQKVNNTIRWINLYPVDNVIGFPDIYLLDSDLSGG